MNSIDNNIQLTYEIENNGILPFLDTLVSRTDKGFSTSVYRKNSFVFLSPHARSYHPPCQKMASFYSFVNCDLNVCSDPISFNGEIQYIKAIAFDRGYNPSVVDKAFFKLQNPCVSHPSYSNSNINIRLLSFPNSSFSIAEILKQRNF